MAQLVYNYLYDIDELKDKAKENANNILEAIDMDELLSDPEGYLLRLGVEFARLHIKEIEKAEKAGIKFGEQVVANSS